MTNSEPQSAVVGESYLQLLKAGERLLKDAGLDSPRLDAEVLLRHAADISRTELFVRYPDPVDAELQLRFDRLLKRRLEGKPVAYLVEVREFMAMPFSVNSGVLVPRPETEILVEWALAHLTPGATIVDVGTGSGAIAVSIAALADDLTVMAVDVSAAALAVASANADQLLSPERRTRISFRKGSLLSPIEEPVAMVLANLPYLTPHQVDGNPDLAAEPRLALDGGHDGLHLIRLLVADLPRVLSPNGGVGLEIDPNQQMAVENLLRTAFPQRQVTTLPDLAGLARHVVMPPE